ncbi:hypothetical protein HHL23_09365 [Chryseobacterium sp. RP-3-3]|uniref:Uncharacterized protein n=1 Tax=Chryseobacterium antibioticum TaxID=2728847 RepID=A0A7Y0AMB4_9FLAO|nr:hypothetical protein [Chryseobacterium antibioticum]NML70008.1 hypothetical protein [Chryseobacterium antibioticum]
MHTEKQRIFDEYAKTREFEDWNDLKNCCIEYDIDIDEYIFEACDLVQQEQQKRIAEKATLLKIDDCCQPIYGVDIDTITNPENIIS